MTDPIPQEIPQDTPPPPSPEIDPGPAPQPEIDPVGTPDEMPQFGDNDGGSPIQPQFGQGHSPPGSLYAAI